MRKSWSDVASQIGAWQHLNSAKKQADKHKGYSVFDENGKIIYSPANKDTTANFKPYTVRVTADVLNVRKGAGWICLDYTVKT